MKWRVAVSDPAELVGDKELHTMESPNLVIVEVTESPKEGSEPESKQDVQQQQQEEQDQQEKEEGTEAAEKSVVSSTKPELGEEAGSICHTNPL